MPEEAGDPAEISEPAGPKQKPHQKSKSRLQRVANEMQQRKVIPARCAMSLTCHLCLTCMPANLF